MRALTVCSSHLQLKEVPDYQFSTRGDSVFLLMSIPSGNGWTHLGVRAYGAVPGTRWHEMVPHGKKNYPSQIVMSAEVNKLHQCDMWSPCIFCTLPGKEQLNWFASINWVCLQQPVFLLFCLEIDSLQRRWIPSCCLSRDTVGGAGCAPATTD